MVYLETNKLSIDERKIELMSYDVIDAFIVFLETDPTQTNDLKYWSILVIHQLSLVESLHRPLIEKGIVLLLSDIIHLTFGNLNMQKLCLHSLVNKHEGLLILGKIDFKYGP